MRESAHVAALRVTLGKCLAGHRERNDLSQRELAQRLYYDRTSISKSRRGNNRHHGSSGVKRTSCLAQTGNLSGPSTHWPTQRHRVRRWWHRQKFVAVDVLPICLPMP